MKGPILFICVCLMGICCNAQGPVLWGMTSAGGNNTAGLLFKYTPAAFAETDIYSFGNNTSDGIIPSGAVMQASNGLVYGLTVGKPDSFSYPGPGIIFSYDPATNDYAVLHTFGTGLDGANPTGSMIQASDGKLYGLTTLGGGGNTPNNGTLFSFDINTNTETVLYSFTNGYRPGGYSFPKPLGKLFQASDGLLYGATSYEYLYGNGVLFGYLFSFDITTSQFHILHSFGDSLDGALPTGEIMQANDSLLFGMTEQGGSNVGPELGQHGGTIFSYNIRSGDYKVVYNFGKNFFDGALPTGGLLKGHDGLLYGTTKSGGSLSGTIFSYNMDIDTLIFLNEFGVNILRPSGSLTPVSSRSDMFYGMTSGGRDGSCTDIGQGTIYAFYTQTGNMQLLYSFCSGIGDTPIGNLIEVKLLNDINQVPNNLAKLQISPNPSQGQFTIQYKGDKNDYPVEIYNAVGQKVKSFVLNEKATLDFTDQPAGVYFVRLLTENGGFSAKVIIAR